MSVFKIKHYSILSSLSDRTFYIKIVDTQCFMCYENNVDMKELRINIGSTSAADVYQLINKCFLQNDDNYQVTIIVNSGIMKLSFIAIVGGFLHIQFDIMLREKIMSNDGQLTFNFTKLKQRCDELCAENEELTLHCDMLTQRLGLMPVPILLNNGYVLEWGYYNADSTELNFIDRKESFIVIFKHIKSFFQLKILKLKALTNDEFTQLNSDTLEELWLQGCASLTSIAGIQKTLPNLKFLTLMSVTTLKDIVKVLKSAPHKIKKIRMICPITDVQTSIEMQVYCDTSKIELLQC